MNASHKRFSIITLLVTLLLALTVSVVLAHGNGEGMAENGLFFVDYRNLNGGSDGVLVMNLDPDSNDFGQILQNFEIGEGVLPHHLYFNHDESRLYNTALGGEFLYELILEHNDDGLPVIQEALPIDVANNTVGEDLYFTNDGSRFYITFMGGFGEQVDGTVGVFDAQTNELIETIAAPVPENPASGEPFILYPHGISANEALNYLAVTSTIHPDGASGSGNTVTLIDMETNEPVQTLLAADAWDDMTVPVEVLLLRDEFEPYVLTTTLGSGDIWVAPYDEATGLFGEFIKTVDGSAEGLGVALEFYIGPGEDIDSDDDKLLYVSFGVPGVVNVYSLDNLPELELVKTLPAAPGAHHMAFFKSESGRELLAVQNNLLNIPDLNAGTLTIVDIHSDELVGTIDLPEDEGLLPESLESALGNGHFYHH